MSNRNLESAPHLLGEAEDGAVWCEEGTWHTVHSLVHHGQ